MKRTIFIGQAMPRFKRNPHDWTSLNIWLYSVGIKEGQIKKYFLYSALVDYFPGSQNGSHLIPSRKDIEQEREKLVKTITDFKPELVTPVGRLSIAYCLNEKVKPLASHIGKVYKGDPYFALGYELTIIPLPHPSGASTWKHKSENKKLLEKTLRLLKHNLISS